MKIIFTLFITLLFTANINSQEKLDTTPECTEIIGENVSSCGAVYEGELKDDKHHGQGTYTFANGDKYVGDFKGSKRHGQGTYNYVNGDKHVGDFKDNKRHGQGTYTFADGDVIEDEWVNGSRKIEYVDVDPKKYWEGAINCYRYTDNPIKESQRPYIDQLTLHVESYKSNNNEYDKDNIRMYSEMIVDTLQCPRKLFV